MDQATPSASAPLLCIDCKHAELDQRDLPPTWYCNHPEAQRSPVDGKSAMSCRDCRADPPGTLSCWTCGPKGRGFEKRKIGAVVWEGNIAEALPRKV